MLQTLQVMIILYSKQISQFTLQCSSYCIRLYFSEFSLTHRFLKEFLPKLVENFISWLQSYNFFRNVSLRILVGHSWMAVYRVITESVRGHSCSLLTGDVIENCFYFGLSTNSSNKKRRYWSVKIEIPVTNLVEWRCHDVVIIRLNCLTVVQVDSNNCFCIERTIYYTILCVCIILVWMKSVGTTELNNVFNVFSFQCGKRRILFPLETCLCFDI